MIEKRLFDPLLEARALLRANGIRDKNASACFSKYLGTTPWAYVTERRMEVAAQLLAQTNLRPWRIAVAIGYNCERTLGKAFKKWGGRSPSEYRRDPNRDPDAWTAPFDLEELEDALTRRLVPSQALVLRRKLRTVLTHLDTLYDPEV